MHRLSKPAPGGRRRRPWPLFAILACLCILAAPVSPAGADDPAAALYQPGRVDVIRMTLEPAALGELEAEPQEYVVGTFSLAETNGTPDGVGGFSAPRKVEVRLKGSASFKDLSEKAAFKLKFKAADAYLGLRKMTLNNMVEDQSMTHEALAYAAFRAAGVPAPRTSFAYVYLNGVDYGLHLDLETLDKVALEKRFGPFQSPPQHLYEGEDGADVRAGEDLARFEVDEGDDAELSDLENLVVAANSGGPGPWSTAVAPFADLTEMTRMWAVEKYVGQYDGYASGVNSFQPNNYYLYSDPAGRFQMLPTGMDEAWQQRNHLAFDEAWGLLFSRCLGDPACLATYRDSLAASCEAIGGVGLDGLAAATAELLAPWQQLEQGNGARHEYDLETIAREVGNTRDFIATRAAEVEDWLGGPCGPTAPAGPVPSPPVGPASPPPVLPADPGPSAAAPAAGSAPMLAAAPALKVGRARYARGAISTPIALAGAGTVVQRATITTKDGPILACSGRWEVGAAGRLDATCPLTARAERRLQRRWLRVTFLTRFDSAAGERQSATRRVALPRLDADASR
jgi:hypothetical protein